MLVRVSRLAFAAALAAAAALTAAAGSGALAQADRDEVSEQEAAASDPSVPPVYPGGALDRDCSHVGGGLGGPGYQFIVACPGRSVSPDGRWAVVAGSSEHGGVVLLDGGERLLDEIPALANGMPFVLFWSPDSRWFFANHYQGSTMQRLRVFEIVNGTAVERSAVYAQAVRTAVERYPCLGRSAIVYASGWRWSRDARRIAMTVYSRPDACLEQTGKGTREPAGDWEVLWMIGDAQTGRIDPASVRVRAGGIGPMPTDGPYSSL